MPYRLLRVGTNDFFLNPTTGQFAEWETGAEAQAAAKEMMEQHGDVKWRVKRVLDTRWKSREAHKFETGFYTHIPWMHEEWWRSRDAVAIHTHHYAHVSRTQPGYMAYTENADKGMDNKQTQIKVGRYLDKYFADVMVMYGRTSKTIADLFEKQYRVRTLHIAKTEDEIQNVYERGPKSCMSGQAYRAEHGWGYPSPGKWPNDYHPCRAYAPELQVAYLTDSDKPTGRVQARSVIWPEKKTFSRCYGDAMQMRQQLLNAGYTEGAPFGAHIQRLPFEDKFIVPYIDASQHQGGGALAVKDCGTYLEITVQGPNTYPANSTSGLSGRKLDRRGQPVQHVQDHCSRCEGHTDDVGDLLPVRRSANNSDTRYWCNQCIDDYARSCDITGEYYDPNIMETIHMSNGERWHGAAFRSHGFICAATGRNLHRNRSIRMHDGSLWDADHFSEHGFECRWTGDCFPNTEAVIMSDGTKWSRRGFAAAGFVCPSCNRNMRLSQRHRDSGSCSRCAETAARADAPIRSEERVR